MDHVGIVVDDLAAATEFFVQLGLVLRGEASLEGRLVDRIVGLEGVRTEVAFMQTPDGHGRLELRGEGQVEGPWVDRIVGLEGVRTDFAFLQTPDGHGRLELSVLRSDNGTRVRDGYNRLSTRGHTRTSATPSDSPICGNNVPANALAWTLVPPRNMVRRGSTVRVRQRASSFLLLRRCFRCRDRRRRAAAASIGRPRLGRRRL
jgi:catechol 2,3-dioxygenase-like lactoylglutathione lyase family enzyme